MTKEKRSLFMRFILGFVILVGLDQWTKGLAVAHLKEKDELDVLISEIFVQKGYIADNLPKTGNRQYGVDVQLHNKSELLLFVIKQGDIDRKVWNDGVNSVRQSLDEIKYVKINLLTDTERKKRIRIIVATNGIRSEAIITNWSGYVNNNRKWNGKPINIEFMGIDDIVNEILENLFIIFIHSLYSIFLSSMFPFTFFNVLWSYSSNKFSAFE